MANQTSGVVPANEALTASFKKKRTDQCNILSWPVPITPQNKLNKMKNKLYSLIIAASLPVIAQTASAQTTILTDNFNVTSGGGDLNSQLASRQTGTQAGSTYIYSSGQVGSATAVGQPGGTANTGVLLEYDNNWVYNSLAFNDTVLGGNKALSISFNLYQQVLDNQDPTAWSSFSFGRGLPSPNQAGQFGFLVQGDQGMQVFDGNNLALDENGHAYVTSDSWTVLLSGTAGGTGSPFDGTTYVQLWNNDDPANNMTGLGLVWSGQLTTALTSGTDGMGDQIGFYCLNGNKNDWNEVGVDNLNVVAAAAPEPATMALAGLGGLSLLFFRRRN